MSHVSLGRRLAAGPTARLAAWAFAAAAAASLVVRPGPPVVVALGGAASALALAAGRRTLGAAALAAALGLALGVARVERLAADPLAAGIGRPFRGRVVVTGDWGGRAPLWRADAEVEGTGARLSLRLAARRPPPRGAVLAAEGDLRRPAGPRHGYDEASLLARRGVRAVLAVRGYSLVGRRGGVWGWLDRVRERSLAAYAPAGDDDAGHLLGSLALGADAELSPRTRDDFRASGLAHLLAVSGSNVALLAALVGVAVWTAGGGRALAQAVAILAIAGYVGVVGPSPSVVRAGVAGVLTAAAWLLSRPVDRWHLFAVGLAVLLGYDPWYVLDPGLELSFAAVAAILLLAPRLERLLEGTPCPPLLAAPVAVSAACTLATAPIAFLQFGQLNLLAAVPANVLAAPAVPALLWLGTLAAVLQPFVPAAAAGCAGVARAPGLYLLAVARLGAWLDGAATGVLPDLLALAGVGCAAAAALARRGGARSRRWWGRR